MAEFRKEKVSMFLAVTRKYMQLRGSISQKDLAERTNIGYSTMSRFLTQKTTELSPTIIAKITASLNIPLHEIIDFVDDEFAERFTRLVRFYKEEDGNLLTEVDPELVETAAEERESILENKTEKKIVNEPMSKKDQTLRDKLENLTPKQRAFLTDFLNLNLEEKDLIVDVANNMFQYFKIKDLES